LSAIFAAYEKGLISLRSSLKRVSMSSNLDIKLVVYEESFRGENAALDPKKQQTPKIKDGM